MLDWCLLSDCMCLLSEGSAKIEAIYPSQWQVFRSVHIATIAAYMFTTSLLLLSSHSCRAISQRKAHQELSEKNPAGKEKTSFLLSVFSKIVQLLFPFSCFLEPFFAQSFSEPIMLLIHSVFRTDTILNHLAWSRCIVPCSSPDKAA